MDFKSKTQWSDLDTENEAGEAPRLGCCSEISYSENVDDLDHTSIYWIIRIATSVPACLQILD